MKFIYTGDSNAPEKAVVFGIPFDLNGDAVEVTDSTTVRKLSGNGSFTAFVESKQPEPVVVEIPKASKTLKLKKGA